MRYYVVGHVADSEGCQDCLWDVYIGENRPGIPAGEGAELEDFDALCAFLRSRPVSLVTLWKEPQCPEELVTRVEQWVGANLSLHDIGSAGGV